MGTKILEIKGVWSLGGSISEGFGQGLKFQIQALRLRFWENEADIWDEGVEKLKSGEGGCFLGFGTTRRWRRMADSRDGGGGRWVLTAFPWQV